MNTFVRSLDRAVTLLVGLALMVAGLAAFVWDRGLLFSWPGAVDLGQVLSWLRQPWVPLVAGFGGALVVLLALWWLIAHIPTGRVRTVLLPGSDAHGRLSVDLSAIAAAAADDVARLPGVTDCRGRALHDRGQLVIELRATLTPATDLTAYARAVDVAVATARGVVGRDDAAIRVRTKVSRAT